MKSDDKDNVVDLNDAGELAFVIATLAATGSVTVTCRRYKELFGKSLATKRCQLIQIKYAKQIRAKSDEYNTPEGLSKFAPLRRRTRAEILWDVVECAMKERVVGQLTQVDENSGEEKKILVIKQDLNSALVALRALKDEDHGWEELQLKKKKAEKDSQPEDESDWEANDATA